MFSIIKTAPFVATSAIGAAATAYDYLNKKHGPKEGYNPEIASTVSVNGEDHKVIGWFGASDETMNKIDFQRALFFGSKAEAQAYALARAKKGQTPQVALIVAKRLPRDKDLMMGCGDYSIQPLSPEGLKNIGAQISYKETVNTQNRIGFGANLKRLLNQKP